jgi:hypothetical protein
VLANARVVVHFYEVPNLEGPEHQQHDARSEVAERALERHSNGEAGSGQHGGKARRLNSKDPQAAENRANENQVARELRKEPREGRVEVALLERDADASLRPARQDEREKERQQDAQNLGAVLH